jgi:hypothetical protein
MRKICCLIIFLIISMNSLIAQGEVINHSDDFVYKQNYSFSSVQLNSITYGNNMFVAVGVDGAIKTSVNGVEWVGIEPLSHNEPNLNKVVWNGKMFVAVGDGGKIIASNNGNDWVSVNSGCLLEEILSDVIWDGKQFIAVGNKSSADFPLYVNIDYGIILKSNDGITWSRELIEDIKLNSFGSIFYTGRGYFVDSHYFSEDASNWSEAMTNGVIYDCTTKEKLLLKINGGEVEISSDGEKWSNKGKSDVIVDDYYKKILWNGNMFVGLWEYGGNSGIQTSSDGVKWNSIESDMLRDLKDICWNGKQFVALGKDTEVFLSADGIKWTRNYSGMKESFNDIVFNGKTYVVVGGIGEGPGIALSSTDGLKWVQNKTPIDACLNSVIWDGKRFVASGGNNVFISKDGISWTKASTQKYSFNDIAWNGKMYVAPVSYEVGNSATIAYSSDGKKWTLKKIGDYDMFSSIAWNGNKFLIIDGNKAWASADGIAWSSKNIDLGEDVFVASSNIGIMGSDFLINANNEVYKSKDGFNWTKYSPDKLGKYGYNAVVNTINRNFMRGYGILGNKDYISADGQNWAVLDYYDENAINSIAYNSNNGKFVIVGNEGILILLEPKKDNSVSSAESMNIIWSKYENKKYDFSNAPFDAELVSDDFDMEKDNLNSITYNGEIYVAVGDNGVIRTSKDSVKWNRVSSNVKSKLNYVLWNEGSFIVVGNEGTILESVDGYTWRDCSLGESVSLKKILWDGKRYIIFSDSWNVYINEDKSTQNDFGEWKSKKIGDYAHFVDAAFNGKTYIISYGNYDSNLYVSNDFENWMQLKVMDEDTHYKYMYYNITWDGEKFSVEYSKYYLDSRFQIPSFEEFRTGILESYDGESWKEQAIMGNITDSFKLKYNSYPIYDGDRVSYMEGEWEYECLPGNISWVEREVGKAKQVNKLIVWTGTNFVLCGKEGAIYTSEDGCKWINRTTERDRIITNNKETNKIIWDGSKYVITTLAGVFTSIDGVEWSGEPQEPDKFEAVGMDGTVLFTKDKEWDKIDSQLADQYCDFYTYKSSNGYIAVGGGYKDTLGYKSKKRGIIFLSKDGDNWNGVDPNVEGFLSSVVYNNGKYVAVGDNGIIITSNDGTTWEKQNSGVKNNLIDIASNGSTYTVVGDGGIMLVSKDGVNWTKTVEMSNLDFYEVNWDDISFKAAANCRQESGYYSATLFSSKDGVKWEVSYVDSLYSIDYNSVFACNGDSYVIVTGERLPMDENNSFIVGKNLSGRPITVFYNGSKLTFDTTPVIENGRALVPMRTIFEALGAEVNWDASSESITSIMGDMKIVLKVGSNKAMINDDSSTLDVSPKIENGRTLVPIRFISESFGTEVQWDGTKRRVTISTKEAN